MTDRLPPCDGMEWSDLTTDRELLEAAARAAGMLTRSDKSGVWIVESDGSPVRRWNPLTDDGDALRLAVNRGFNLDIETACGVVSIGNVVEYFQFDDQGAAQAATRRAIVRAAA